MDNWVAITGDTLHFSLSLIKPNGVDNKLSFKSSVTDYGLFLPLIPQAESFYDFVEEGLILPRALERVEEVLATLAGSLVTSQGKVYLVILHPNNKFNFRRVQYGEGSMACYSAQFQTEAIIRTILSYTTDPIEVIEASEKMFLVTPGLRSFAKIEDLAKQIAEIKVSRSLSELPKVSS